jgi:flagellar protein FliJ
MKRTERLKMVQNVAEDLERRRASQLALSEQRVGDTESRLQELEHYRKQYCREFAHRASGGIGAAGLRDYQIFLARLAEAIRQQSQLVLRMRTERDSQRLIWQSAAQRAEALTRLVNRWQTEERHALDRSEQRATDEQAQRGNFAALNAHGT